MAPDWRSHFTLRLSSTFDTERPSAKSCGSPLLDLGTRLKEIINPSATPNNKNTNDKGIHTAVLKRGRDGRMVAYAGPVRAGRSWLDSKRPGGWRGSASSCSCAS